MVKQMVQVICRNIQFRKNTCIQTIHKYWVLSNCMQHPRKIMKVYRNKFRNIYSRIFQCKLCDPLCKEILSRPWYCAFSFGSFIFWRRCLNIEILVMVNNRCSVKKICKFGTLFLAVFWECVQIVSILHFFNVNKWKWTPVLLHPIHVITLNYDFYSFICRKYVYWPQFLTLKRCLYCHTDIFMYL